MGYDESPDYGGPAPTVLGVLSGLVMLLAVAALFAWWLQ